MDGGALHRHRDESEVCKEYDVEMHFLMLVGDAERKEWENVVNKMIDSYKGDEMIVVLMGRWKKER